MKASGIVVDFVNSSPLLREHLGDTYVKSESFLTKVSLYDYDVTDEKKKFKKSKPTNDHILLGIPNQSMRTCNKISTENGPVYRNGGLYIDEDNGVLLPGILVQIYCDKIVSYAVVEELVQSPRTDSFLQEVGLHVWRRSRRYRVVSNFKLLKSLPLFHACKFDDYNCQFDYGVTTEREERVSLQRFKNRYKCAGSNGNYFIASACCLSLPFSSGFGCT